MKISKTFLIKAFVVIAATAGAFYYTLKFTPEKAVDLMLRYQEREYVLRTSALTMTKYAMLAGAFLIFAFACLLKTILKSTNKTLRALIKCSELVLLQDWEQAEKYQIKITKVLENNLKNYNSLLKFHISSGRRPRISLSDLKALAKIEDFSFFANKKLSETFFVLEEYKQSIFHAKQVLRSAPNDEDILKISLISLSKLKLWKDFFACIDQIDSDTKTKILSNEELSELYLEFAKDERKSLRYDEAIEAAKKSLFYNRVNIEAFKFLYAAYSYQGKGKESFEILKEQFAASPSLDVCVSLRQVSYFREKELYAFLADLADPKDNIEVFLAICAYLGLREEANYLIENKKIRVATKLKEMDFEHKGAKEQNLSCKIVQKDTNIYDKSLSNGIPMVNANICKFISFEGGEGSGKTTQSLLLHKYLNNRSIKNVLTREPGGSDLGEELRTLLKKQHNPTAELLLLLASRHDHVRNLILPSLSSNVWVICDRFVDSTMCYQGLLKGLGLDYIKTLHDQIIGDIWPNVTFLLDLPATNIKSRVETRDSITHYDSMPIEQHQVIRKGFLEIAQSFPNRIHVLDATCSEKEIHKEIIRILGLPF